MMSNSQSGRAQITTEITALEKKIRALKERLPAHSIPAALILELDELDEQLSDARQRLAKINTRVTD
jgi:chromosome segregation ATPase